MSKLTESLFDSDVTAYDAVGSVNFMGSHLYCDAKYACVLLGLTFYLRGYGFDSSELVEDLLRRNKKGIFKAGPMSLRNPADVERLIKDIIGGVKLERGFDIKEAVKFVVDTVFRKMVLRDIMKHGPRFVMLYLFDGDFNLPDMNAVRLNAAKRALSLTGYVEFDDKEYKCDLETAAILNLVGICFYTDGEYDEFVRMLPRRLPKLKGLEIRNALKLLLPNVKDPTLYADIASRIKTYMIGVYTGVYMLPPVRGSNLNSQYSMDLKNYTDKIFTEVIQRDYDKAYYDIVAETGYKL